VRMLGRERTSVIVSGAVCNLCGSEQAAPLVERWGMTVVRCSNCGLAFTHPQPEETASRYDEDYFRLYARRGKFRRRRMARRLRCIELIEPPGRILDIGCSLGYFLEVAAEAGWEPYGVDISPYAALQSGVRGFDARVGSLEEAHFETGFFDCVTMWDVLEHVPDPTAQMLEVHRILRPGGLVAIGTPDIGHLAFRIKRAGWRHLKPAEHLYYFNRSTLAALLEKTGFRQVRPRLSLAAGPARLGAGLRQLIGRTLRVNDVLLAYGVSVTRERNGSPLSSQEN